MARRSQPNRGKARRLSAVHFSSRTDDWTTPEWLFERLNAEFHFTLDPCSTTENAKCQRHYTREEDGLAQDWSRDIVFMNPPYGREISRWMSKAVDSALSGATVVCLVPARTDTKWWHRFAMRGQIEFLPGRLKFGTAVNSAPFPSAVVVFRSGFQCSDFSLNPDSIGQMRLDPHERISHATQR